MRIHRLTFRNFRGFDQLCLLPQAHVLLVGPPGAGRSDLIEGLRRVLQPESTRFPLSEPLDFHKGNIADRAEVEVVLGGLDHQLEQRFLDQLEVWDRTGGHLRLDMADLDQLQDAQHEWVLRLCYRARWDADEKAGEHWVDFAKNSDPDGDQFQRASRVHRQAIPFAAVQPSGRPLDLSAGATFRSIVDSAEGKDFIAGLDGLQEGLGELAGRLGDGRQVQSALSAVLDPVRPRLHVRQASSDVVRFLPEGGAFGAVIRSLGASVDLEDGIGPLPLGRHGSTLRSLFAVSEALGAVGGRGGIVIADDFGEDMDAASALHLAATLRAHAGQVWLATRRGAVAEAFSYEEIVRLARRNGARRTFQPVKPGSKQEKIAAQYVTRLLMNEVASEAVVIGEGPHDRETLNGLARKRFEEGLDYLPSARGVSIVDAGAGDSGGGTSKVPKLAEAAGQLGFRTVAVIDHDRVGAEDTLAACQAAADCVVRLRQGCAIEAALLDGLSDEVIVRALQDIGTAFSLAIPAEVFRRTGEDLRREAVKWLHKGYHRQFVEVLPVGVFPQQATDLLLRAVAAAVDGDVKGHLQL